jgi:integrase
MITYPHILESHKGRVAIYLKKDDRYTHTYRIKWRQGTMSHEEIRVKEEAALARAQEVFDGLNGGAPITQKDMADLQTFRAVETMLKGEASLLDAVRFFLDHHDNRSKEISVPQAIADYYTSLDSRGLSPEHLKMVAFHLTRFEVAAHPAKTLRMVTVDQINKLLLTYDSPRYRDNARSTLKSFFTWAKKNHYVMPNGETAAHRSDRPNVPKKDPCIFTPEGFAKLIYAASPEIAPYLAIGAFAGCRASEIRRLTPENINLEQGIISLPSSITKTGRRRIAKISDNLKAWLEKFPLVQCGDPQEQISALCKKIGVAWVNNGPRKSFISHALACGNNTFDIAANCGHNAAVAASHYVALATPEQGKAWFNIFPL